jgi:hypothetical protein
MAVMAVTVVMVVTIATFRAFPSPRNGYSSALDWR